MLLASADRTEHRDTKHVSTGALTCSTFFTGKEQYVLFESIEEGKEYQFKTHELTQPVRVRVTYKHINPDHEPLDEEIGIEILEDVLPLWEKGTLLTVSPLFLEPVKR